MTEYIPGRIYSARYLGDDPELFLCSTEDLFVGIRKAVDPIETLTDVRGPLVVLDLHVYGAAVIDWLTERLRDLDATITHDVAAQIEEQTRPPLQVGVHLARLDDVTAYLRWDGKHWWTAKGDKLCGPWESVRFIGPAGDDA